MPKLVAFMLILLGVTRIGYVATMVFDPEIENSEKPEQIHLAYTGNFHKFYNIQEVIQYIVLEYIENK